MNRLVLALGLIVFSFLALTPAEAATNFKPNFKYDHKKAHALYLKTVKPNPIKAERPLPLVPHSNSRQIAAAETDLTSAAIVATFSSDFKKIRKELIGDDKTAGITTKEGLDDLVIKYSDKKTYNELNGWDAKFLALQIRALKPMKSFIFRAKDYVEKNSITRTMIVSALRAQISGIDHFYPVSESNKTNYPALVFQYITEPFPDMKSKISEDGELYNEMTDLTNFVRNEIDLYRALIDANPTFWWDNKLYAPFANFVNEKDQYVKLGYEEHLAIYAAGCLNVSGLYSLTAYSFSGLAEAAKQNAKLFGVDAGDLFNKLGVEGMSSENKIKALTKDTPELFNGNSETKGRMERAYDFLNLAVQTSKTVYDRVKMRSADDQRLFEARFVTPFVRGGDNSLRNLATLFELPNLDPKMYGKDSTVEENSNFAVDAKSKTVRSAVVRGDVIQVDLKAFFMDPPKNLKELYPVAWRVKKTHGEKEDSKVDAWDGKDRLRNYRYGMAVEWNIEHYKKIFPQIQPMEKDQSRTAELGKYARILSQTWGASGFALPISFFIF